MFAVYCPNHGRRVLLSEEAILALELVEGGIELRYRCTCGYEGTCRTGHDRHPSCLAG
jgi:hypothetical protein